MKDAFVGRKGPTAKCMPHPFWVGGDFEFDFVGSFDTCSGGLSEWVGDGNMEEDMDVGSDGIAMVGLGFWSRLSWARRSVFKTPFVCWCPEAVITLPSDETWVLCSIARISCKFNVRATASNDLCVQSLGLQPVVRLGVTSCQNVGTKWT